VLAIQSFKGWYKSELWEAIKSLLIVAVVFSAIVIVGSLATLLPGPGSLNACFPGLSGTTSGFDLIYYTAYSTFGTGTCVGSITYTNDSYNLLFGIAMGTEFLKSIRVAVYFTIPFPPIPVPVPVFGALDLGSTFNVYQSSIIDASPVSGPGSFMGQILTFLIFPMTLALSVQYVLFPTIIAVSLGVLLPLGLIFRATPFLRAIGGTLIALAIAGAIIYPILLAMLNAPLVYFFSPLYPSGLLASAPTLNCPLALQLTVCSVLNEFSITFINIPFMTGFYDGISAFILGNLYYILNPVFFYLFPVIVQFILFIVDLLIGIVATRAVARTLGGDLRLSIGKIKMT
jgi:hypothetical protein